MIGQTLMPGPGLGGAETHWAAAAPGRRGPRQCL